MSLAIAALVLASLIPTTALPAEGPKGEGTNDRSWVTGPAEPPASISKPSYPIVVVPALIPMRDGASLVAQLYLPIRQPGEAAGPCVLIPNGYSPPAVTAPLETANIALGLAFGEGLADLARRGYAGAHVWMRSLDVPESEALYYRYREDGYDIVEWMAAQDWCDGNVGTIGTSLYAISQWLIAKERPPSLKAIVPSVGCGDCYWYLWYPGGMLPAPSRKEGRAPPYTPYDEYGAAVQHRDYDDWWQARNTEPADHQAMAGQIAVMNIGGWEDYIHAGGMRGVEDLVAAGGDGIQVVGPWIHVDASSAPGLMPYSFQTMTVLWFDRFLKGIDNGIDEIGAVIFVEGPNQYRIEEEWPIPDAHTTRLFLRAQPSGSASSLNDGSLTPGGPSANETSVGYDYSPQGPYNDAGGSTSPPTGDQRADEKHSLTWTTEALSVPTEVTGWPALNFWASSTATDTDFVVEITDVAPDGTSTQVARGWLNAPRSFSRSAPPLLEPGEAYEFSAELWPLAHVFPAGHRIRVSLAGSDHGGAANPDPTSLEGTPGFALNPNPATVTVFQDEQHPSHVELPIIGTAWQWLEGAS